MITANIKYQNEEIIEKVYIFFISCYPTAFIW